MTDRPIIFSAPMVRALLDGRKTQTRRILKPQPPTDARYTGVHYASNEPASWFFNSPRGGFKVRERFEQGDRLWVRENCQAVEQPSGEDGVHFIADEAWHPIQAGSRGAADDWLTLYSYGKGRRRGAVVPSIHMPRWASRLTLVVTDVRVERLLDISEEDAIAEGAAQYASSTEVLREWDPALKGSYRAGFLALWDRLHSPESTDANPWVAAISFRVHHANINALRADALDLAGAA